MEPKKSQNWWHEYKNLFRAIAPGTKATILYTVVMSFITGYLLLYQLREAGCIYSYGKACGSERPNALDRMLYPTQTDTTSTPASKQTTGLSDALAAGTKVEQADGKTQSQRGLPYFPLLLLMLTAGAMGGVLHNMAGFFERYRDKQDFVQDLLAPYVLRPFSGAICGMFVFFLAKLIAVGLDTGSLSNMVSFEGMVSFVGFAIVAGYGSQEFMDRLKATIQTMFGANNDAGIKSLKSYQDLLKNELITQAEYDYAKSKILGFTATNKES